MNQLLELILVLIITLATDSWRAIKRIVLPQITELREYKSAKTVFLVRHEH